ncbi:hypothetical protein [Nocardia brevicatena]|uniref:hypothetical protein n=1 Tax=Nocardia brevicatena TaxID=37327 RepID=UPI0002F4B195|nr:hypothetical protein [Nocardia brevicatena]
MRRFLPMLAAVESVRSILYFGGDTVGDHLVAFAMRVRSPWRAYSSSTGSGPYRTKENTVAADSPAVLVPGS